MTYRSFFFGAAMGLFVLAACQKEKIADLSKPASNLSAEVAKGEPSSIVYPADPNARLAEYQQVDSELEAKIREYLSTRIPGPPPPTDVRGYFLKEEGDNLVVVFTSPLKGHPFSGVFLRVRKIDRAIISYNIEM